MVRENGKKINRKYIWIGGIDLRNKIYDNVAKEEDKKIIAEHLVKNYTLKEKSSLFGVKKEKIVNAVKDISIEIPQGKIIGVLGINGAGKTTTIRMLASIIAPTSGKLIMNGVNAVKNHLWVKERINIISGGERNLYWRLTANENLKYFGSLYGLSGKYLEEKIVHLLKIVGLEEAANIPVERYSKGMKQRLQIARGLINNPEYIFLDEPTLGLDIVIAKEIRRVVADLAKGKNKGVLLTTHYIREAEELCDYIYVLDKGEIIAQGTKEELKELFMYKPILIVEMAQAADQIYEDISNELNADIKIVREEKKIKISGDANTWPQILNLLTRHNGQIVNLSIQEATLEEVLMKIIYQSRGEKFEKNLVSN